MRWWRSRKSWRTWRWVEGQGMMGVQGESEGPRRWAAGAGMIRGTGCAQAMAGQAWGGGRGRGDMGMGEGLTSCGGWESGHGLLATHGWPRFTHQSLMDRMHPARDVQAAAASAAPGMANTVALATVPEVRGQNVIKKDSIYNNWAKTEGSDSLKKMKRRIMGESTKVVEVLYT